MATRSATFTLHDNQDLPAAGEVLVFKLLQYGTATDAPIHLRRGVKADPTAADGTGSITLWVNDESEKTAIYRVTFPSGESGEFVMPAGAGDIDLSNLLINYNADTVDPQAANQFTLKADRDAGNIGAGQATAWRSALNVEDGADVTDVDNVRDAGALMDDEVADLTGIKTLTLPDGTTISTFAATLLDDTNPASFKSTLTLGSMADENTSSYLTKTLIDSYFADPFNNVSFDRDQWNTRLYLPDAIVVEGATGSPIANATYLRDGDNTGKPLFTVPGGISIQDSVQWDSGSGGVFFIARGNVALYTSTDTVETPDLVTTWTATLDGTTPVPTVRRATWPEYLQAVLERDAAASRTSLGLEIGTNVQAHIGGTTVIVQSLDDLPAPAGGVITLANDTSYHLYGLINIGTNTITCGTNNALVGSSPAHDGIIYTGVDDCITALNTDLYMRAMSVIGTVFGSGLDYTNTTQDKFLNVLGCAFIGLTNAVTIDGIDVGSFESTMFRNCVNGITKLTTNPGTKILVAKGFFDETPVVNAGTAIDIQGTSTLRDFDLLDSKFQTTTTGTFIDIADSTTVTNRGTIDNSRFQGPSATTLNGIDFSTLGWSILNNDGLENTRINGQYGFSGNTVATIINTSNVWEKVGVTGAIATTATLVSGFTHTSPNTLEYIRKRPRVGQITIAGNVKSAAVNQDFEIGVFKNGTLNQSTALQTKTAGVLQQFSFPKQIALVQGDEIDVRVRNTTSPASTSDFTFANLDVTFLAIV